jgi:hypothetical protein
VSHVFVSYVRENSEQVRRLCDYLESHGVEVWLDRDAISPGQRWKDAIRTAIQKGAFFLACFSSESVAKDRSYMNEELTLAIEELRQRPTDRTWFIPVLLSKCEIPDRSIGAGEGLRDLQWLDLSSDWYAGLERILPVLRPKSSRRPVRNRQPMTPSNHSVALEALQYAKRSIMEYDGYPSYEFRQQQLWRVDEEIQNLQGGMRPLKFRTVDDKPFREIAEHYRGQGYESLLALESQLDAKLDEGYEFGLDPSSGRQVWLVFQAGSIVEEHVFLVRKTVPE